NQPPLLVHGGHFDNGRSQCELKRAKLAGNGWFPLGMKTLREPTVKTPSGLPVNGKLTTWTVGLVLSTLIGSGLTSVVIHSRWTPLASARSRSSKAMWCLGR